MAGTSQLDLLIRALILIRKASSAIDTALGMPAADRARVEESLDAVRRDLNKVLGQVGRSIPGASVLSKRPEVKMAAGAVEFVARQTAAQLGVLAGAADAVRLGGDSRSLADGIGKHLAEVGVASREDLAVAIGVEDDSPRFQEALERALGTGRAEWYAPNVYGIPREAAEELSAAVAAADEEAEAGEVGDAEPPTLGAAVSELERSLDGLGRALADRGLPSRPSVDPE